MTPETLAQKVYNSTNTGEESGDVGFIDIITIIAIIVQVIKIIQECQKDSKEVKGMATEQKSKGTLIKEIRKTLPFGKKHRAGKIAEEVYKIGSDLNEQEIAQLLKAV